MNRTKTALTFIIVFVIFAVWAGNLTHSARRASEDFVGTLAEGKIPGGISGSVRLLAENLLEFGGLSYTVEKVRLTPALLAKAEVVLDNGRERTAITLTLKRTGGRWQPWEAAGSEVAVRQDKTQPLLILSIGQVSLDRELEALGRDKLLTLQTDRADWLNRGWRELAPYFAAFFEGRPAQLVVGMTELELYGHDDSLAAVVLRQPYVPDNIRVNLSTTGYEGIRHGSVEISSAAPWYVTEAVTGRSITLDPGTVHLQARADKIILDSREFGNRLIFSPVDPSGQLQVSSISRSGGRTPAYYGTLEAANFDEELIIVNEVPLEQYLCYVVPSEMPASFGNGALEVQAVVARTFALRSLYASEWRTTSAHVVDSVLSQVYNNGGTNPAAVAAVEETRGEYIAFNGRPADVRYYSTGSGNTGNAHEVWPDADGNFPGVPVPWLVSLPQYPGDAQDIRGEASFADFIHNPPDSAYDAGSAWFRWRVTVPARQLEGIIRDNLKSIFDSSPSAVQRRDESGNYVPVQEMPEDPLGSLLDLVPAQRGEGGVLMAVDIIGSNGIWRVQREYYIRHVLRPQGSTEEPIELILHNGSRRNNFSLLPSAYVVWDLERTDRGLEYIRFYGGGFGHGVGMSQYGVRELAKRGWAREQIIQHYFPGVEIIRLGGN